MMLAGGILIILAMLTRILARAEMVSYLLLAVTIVLVDSARRQGKSRRLWWLVVVFMLWVNIQSLFVVGMGVVLSAVGGAWLDRRLGRENLAGGLARVCSLWPILACMVACLISPQPIRTVLYPFELYTRISGQQEIYTKLVSEFSPLWKDPFSRPYTLLLAGLTVVVMAARARRVPVGHWLWALAGGYLAVTAIRNTGLLAVIHGYLLLFHGGKLLTESDNRVTRILCGRFVLVTVSVVAIAICATFPFEQIRRWSKDDGRPGLGLQCDSFPLVSAQRLGDLKIPGNVFCANFGDSGTFTYFTGPLTDANRRVYLDGWGSDTEKILKADGLRRILGKPELHG